MDHFASRCPDKMVNRAEIVEGAHPTCEQTLTFNSLEMMAGGNGSSWRDVDLKATSVVTSYTTCPPIMTEVCIEDLWMVRFECDTAASHNILSADLYNGLRKQKSGRIPAMKQENLAIRLADGTVSIKACGSIHLAVKENTTGVVVLLHTKWTK